MVTSSQLRQRFALWVLGRFLPDAKVLVPHARTALVAVGAAAAAGVLLALVLVAALAVLWFYLSAQDASEGVIIAVMGTVSLLLAVIAVLLAQRSLKSTANISRSLRSPIEKDLDMLPMLAGQLLQSFLTGLTEPLPEEYSAFKEEDEQPHTNGVHRTFHH